MNENATTLQNKLTWATGAIKQAIETMTPPEGRRDYNKHTVACRENLQGILKLIETPEAKAEAAPSEVAERAIRAMKFRMDNNR